MTTFESIAHLPERYGKLTTPSQASIVLLIVVVLTTLVGIAGIKSTADVTLTERATASKHIVQAAVNSTWYYYNQFLAGKISEADAQEAAKSVINSMTFGDSNYVFVYQWRGEKDYALVVNKVRPDLVGVNRYNAISPDKVYYVRALTDAARNGGGYTMYEWDAGGTSPVARTKLTYSEGFGPWRWAIGTGSYIDDTVDYLWDKILTLISIAGASLALGVSFITWLHRWGISKNVDRRLHHRRLP